MRKRNIIPAAAAAAAAAAIAITGAASGSTATKNERFTLITTSTAAAKPDYSVVATGGFIDGGIATHEPKGELTLHLTSGTITLDREKPHPQGTKTETATACMQIASSRFSYTIAGGTGTYKGISGAGRATEHDAFIEQVVHGSCSTSFAAAQGVITLTGTVSLS
jgi:hypothetical protein